MILIVKTCEAHWAHYVDFIFIIIIVSSVTVARADPRR